MPFQVYLSPTTASPPDAQVQAMVRAAVVAEGGKIDGPGVTIETADGVKFKMVRGYSHFFVDQLSPSFCRILFNAALRSNSTVDRGGPGQMPLQMRGSRGDTRYVRMTTEQIADPPALCARLGQDLQAWNRYIRDAQADGVLGPDEQPLEPPAGPGTEPRLTNEPTGVAAGCEANLKGQTKLRLRIVRKVISQNSRYGVVWRADVTMRGHRPIPSRYICWKDPERSGLNVVARPLEMFDPSQSVPPLSQ